MCGNEEDARDVLQETMLATFRNVKTFRGDARLSTWLYQVARSFCSKSRRRATGAPAAYEPLDAGDAAILASDEAPPDAHAHARRIGSLLQSAISTLPPSQREALILRDVQGLTASEAARIVGVDVAALKTRLHRARVELRRKLSDLHALEGEGTAASPCPELARELAAFSGEDLDRSTCARIEQHLRGCERCSGACEALRRTISLCRQIGAGDIPAQVRASVRDALIAARSDAGDARTGPAAAKSRRASR